MKWGHSPFPGKRGQASSIGTALIVALSGFLMGFDGSLFTGALVFVEQNFHLTDFEIGWAVVSHTLTATLSIFLAGPLADRFGRRTVLRAAALVFAASAAVAAVSGSFGMLIVARLLSGIGVGAVLVASPMYIAEISPPALRGRLVTLTQLFVVLGIFLAFSSNYLIVRLEDIDAAWLPSPASATASWRWMLGIGALPAIIYLLALMLVPESPRWHAMHGRPEAARRILARAHGEELAEAELAEVRASLATRGSHGESTLRDLRDPALRGVLAIGLIVGVLQQITGINSVLAYATVMFGRLGDAGAPEHTAFLQTVLIGLINLVATVVSLLLIDRVGRRPLFIAGSAGIAVSLLVTAFGFSVADSTIGSAWVLAGLLGFVGFFAVSLGPGLWVLLSEIFPNRIRAIAISFVGLVNSTVCVLAQFVFPWQMKNLGGGYTFLIYGIFAIAGLALLVRKMPETRGRSLEQLEMSLVRRQ
jgi:SP family arabinose:H+ symporter-like MFS transporter